MPVTPPDSPTSLAAWLAHRRRALLRLLKREERERTGALPAPLRSYSQRFLLEFRSTPPRPCALARVASAVAAADIVFSADYHASPHPGRTHLRWLRLLARAGRPVTLALELVSSRHQEALEAFGSGRLAEADFLRRIRFERDWGFAWRPYRRLLREARALGCRLLALDHPERSRGATVLERDRHAGEQLAREIVRRPHQALLVVAGEMHLAQPHLPRATRRACRRVGVRPRMVTLFHGSEALYFRLGRQGLEGRVAAQALGGERYCLLEAAPWVRLLAHLCWLESQEPAPVAVEPEDCVVAWTARTLATLAGLALPARLQPPDDLPVERLPLPERVSRRAVALLERSARPVPELDSTTRAVWLALARCLVDPPLGAGGRGAPRARGRGRAARDGAPAGYRLYRRLVEGRADGAEVRAALGVGAQEAEPPHGASERSRTHSSPSGS